MARLRYLGGGWLHKIPARDLTAEEVRNLGGVKNLIASGLYEDLYPPKEEPAEEEPEPDIEVQETIEED